MKTRALFGRAPGVLPVLLASFLASAAARGALSVTETRTDKGCQVTFKMTVSPAAEPVPALKHRLTSREVDLKQGDAAPFYYRALIDAPAKRKALDKEFGEDYHAWHSCEELPLEEIPLEKAREALKIWGDLSLENVRTAAGRRRCDWQWNVEENRGQKFFAFVLDEMQESRALARSLVLRARLALAEGRIDEAVDLLRINYRLARDVAKEPLLICDLVGMGVTSMCNMEIVELIAQPGSPNLYWALSELPRPPISIRESIRLEGSSGLRLVPVLLNAETEEHAPEEWARLLTKAYMDLRGLGGGDIPFVDAGPTVTQAAVTGYCVFAYPHAKQRLIDAGMNRRRVEQMPVGQVIAIDASREYRRIADDLVKWYYVPFRTMCERHSSDVSDESEGMSATVTRGYGYVLAMFVTPAFDAARTAEQRLLWQLDGIRTVEAIRMHAAQTGRLPKSLDEIKVVPVPENPATGKAFEYRLDDDTAILELPFRDGFPGTAWRFEITLAK